ncbi:MAG: VWA domain-containing protein [Alphaproteobacteria bacterium]|nr:VWA domain-containing protein [Alphaproteobacteria bacterium]
MTEEEGDDPFDALAVDPRIDRAMRWRLLLGRHGTDALPVQPGLGRPDGEGGGIRPRDLESALDAGQEIEKVLDFIYDREFAKRSHRQAGKGSGSGLTIPAWLSGVRDLFPREAAEVIERDALHRYGLTELVTDPEILSRAEPTTDLLKAIVQFKHLMKGPVLEIARQRVREIVDRIRAELETDCQPALTGPARPAGGPAKKSFRNVDWTRTIRRNLKNYDPETQQLVADRIDYRHRAQDRSRWRIVISVDQSGSMTDSLIHAAVMAGIFAHLPAVSVNLVLWDHRIVDMTEHAGDPLEILMGVQLGGGTDMLPALQYCSALVTEPARTLFVLLSDFYVWGDRAEILAHCEELSAAGVRGIGLCALDSGGTPIHDAQFARELADRGWFVGALTPRRLAEHVGRILRG